MALSITIYGAASEIGGNKILLEDGDTRVLLDFGTSFKERGQYYEEFLNPRAPLGLLDPLVMGLLPPLQGVYRDDIVVSPDVWAKVRNDPHYREIPEIHGVLLSHAHVDHSGYISFLKETIPVHTTRMSAFIAKAMQDVTGSDLEGEVGYTTPRSLGDKGVLVSDRKRYVQRSFAFLDGFPESQQAHAFWTQSPTKAKTIEPGPIVAAGRVAGLAVRSFYVDHSIFGASAFAVETSIGWVVYTGDVRFHGVNGHLTSAFIEAAAGLRPAVLLCEGTNVTREAQTSESEVYENALRLVRGAEGLVVADFGARQIERLLSFRRIAQETQRTLVILAKDQYMLDAMHLASAGPWTIDEMPDITIYAERKGLLSTVEERVREAHAGRLVSPETIHADPARYILCLSFFDIKHLIDIDPPPGGLYIYSSSEAYEEEQAIDQRRLQNWLTRFGLRSAGFDPTESLHASGHAIGPDLLRLARRIAPRHLIPIHTTQPEFYVQNLKNDQIKIALPQTGVRLVFQ